MTFSHIYLCFFFSSIYSLFLFLRAGQDNVDLEVEMEIQAHL